MSCLSVYPPVIALPATPGRFASLLLTCARLPAIRVSIMAFVFRVSPTRVRFLVVVHRVKIYYLLLNLISILILGVVIVRIYWEILRDAN